MQSLKNLIKIKSYSNMKILFIHQNFPGQFKHLAPALVARGHDVFGMTLQRVAAGTWNGVKLVPYTVSRGSTQGVHPWVVDFETKIIRAEGAFYAMRKLRDGGFHPDIVVAHPGWGESLFVKDVWPNCKLAIYCEFFYKAKGADVGFDPEFEADDAEADACRLKIKNINNMLHFEIADAGISPTHWQASTFPQSFRQKITVIHDGIDTDKLIPNNDVKLILNNNKILSRQDEVVTFVNRNLEPYRGFHIFMRALPKLMKMRPNVRVLIVGGNDVSYGSKPEPSKYGGLKSWRDIFVNEIRPHIKDNDWERIHFLGNLPYEYFIALLQLSTVHVYLTYPFVLSWSLLEAMSVGCAIVASDTPPLWEAIKHDNTGRLVDFFDVDGLVREITGLLDDAQMRRRLGENARKFAVENYDLRRVCLPRQIEWVESLRDI